MVLFGMDVAGEGVSSSRPGRPKINLEAVGIEPATHDMESRLTTNSTVLTVMTWRVVCTLIGEYGRFWKNRSWVSRRVIQNARVCGFVDE